MAGKLILTGAVLAAALNTFALFATLDSRARWQRQLATCTAERIAREGKTDREFYTANPKHFPTEATSTRKKD